MSYSKITKTKHLLVLFLLLATTVITSINFSYTNIIQNQTARDSETNKNNDNNFDIEKNLLMADYSSSFGKRGDNLNISLHQSLVNLSQGDFSNLDNSNTLKEACPTDTSFNSIFTNIIVEDIYAPNKSIVIEDNTVGAGLENFFLGEYYVSFTTRGSGFLENVSIPIKLVTALNNANVTIKLYNARNDGSGVPEPNSNIGLIVPKTLITSSTYYWHEFTNIHAAFDSSSTFANTFFLRVEKVQGGAVYWDWYSDGTDADETYVYDATLILETFGVNTIDLGLKVAFSPQDHTPTPEGINFLINSTSVTGDLVIENKGSWKSYNAYRNASGLLYFVLTAEWWDVSCSVTYAQINYTKTDLTATSLFSVTGSGESLNWNSTLGIVNNFVSPFNNYEINFTVPRTWENFSAFKGPTDKSSDINIGPINEGYLDLQIKNAENGINWYIMAQSKNLLKKIRTYVGIEDLSIINFTDTLNFLANFSEIISDGTINLTVYSPAPGYHENYSYYDDSITPDSEISLGSWAISSSATEYGMFKVQIWWYNATAGGFLEKDITIIAVTDLVLISPPIDEDHFPDDIFNIRVFYNDTGLNSGDQGIPGATIIINGTYVPPIVDEGNGYYQIQINSSDYIYKKNYIGIYALKTNYNGAFKRFSFHLRQYTSIAPSDSKNFGDIIRGTIVSYEFNYSDVVGTPITGAIPSIVDLDPSFLPGSSISENVGEPGNYTIQLDTSDVVASAIPYECIFNVIAIGKEAKNITIYLTVILSQTSLNIIESESYLLKRDGLNQTVLFYFNDTDNNLPITGLPVGDVTVTDNQTGLPRNIWLFPNGTDGYYILNISITALNSGWIELTIDITFDPNYATSIAPVIFYYEGNNTQTYLRSMSDPGGEGSLRCISSTYTCFIGRDIYIDFNITDTNNGNSLITGLANSYIVQYVEVGNPGNQGVLGHSLNNAAISYQGSIDTSDITILGTYEITVKVYKTDFETSILSFNLTLRALYIIDIVVDYPAEITAGDSFHVIIQVNYYNTTDWLLLVGSNVRITPYFKGTPGTPSSWLPTNNTGEVEFEILTSNTIRNITLTIEVQSEYYHEADTKNIYNIKVNPPFGLGDILPYLIIAGIAAIAIASSVGVYKGVVVPKKREKSRVLTEVKTIFDDAINLEHILVLYKGTGTCIYFKSFGSEQIDPELISGFISAISSFGKDLVSQEELNEISYGDKMLLLSDGEYIRVALVLGKKASLILRRNLMEFIHGFEKSYNNELPNWRGQLNIFRDAGNTIDEILNTSIILPHEITYEFSSTKTLKKQQSKEVLKVATNLMKDSERNFFFIATLLKVATEKTSKDTAQIFMGIKELRDKKILMPIEISAIETKPISQQELNLINQKVSQLVSLSAEEKQKLVNDLAQMGPAEREAYFVSLTEQQEIISAPIEAKLGAAVINNIKAAKKEIKNLKKNGIVARKEKDYDKSIKIFQNALKIASNWELTKEAQEFDDFIRLTKIVDLKTKMQNLEQEARLAAKQENYNEAAQKYKMSSKIASEIFKLGEDLTKEVKRLSNKAKEYEKLI
ncbi:MAG: hypothetical protein ACFFA4_05075 [Promethearchaeota archaeon]